MTETAPPADLVLMLTDTTSLVDVAPLARRGAAPTLWSVTLDSAGAARGILATEAQLVRHRDLIDQAIDRARTIERANRNKENSR